MSSLVSLVQNRIHWIRSLVVLCCIIHLCVQYKIRLPGVRQGLPACHRPRMRHFFLHALSLAYLHTHYMDPHDVASILKVAVMQSIVRMVLMAHNESQMASGLTQPFDPGAF